MLWTEKYKPTTLKEMGAQLSAVNSLHRFVANYGRQKKRAALIVGPTGSGKSCAVYALANELGYEIVEINASDLRNKDAIGRIVGGAVQQRSLFHKGKIVLVDEIDGLAGNQDRGGIGALSEFIDKTSMPIVMTANDPWDKKLAGIRKKSEIIKFHKPNAHSIAAVLRKICHTEKLECDDDAVESLARISGGDFRGAINDLQTLASDGSLKKAEISELSTRNREESIINALIRIFKTTEWKTASGALEEVKEDLDDCILWIDENLPKEYTKTEDIMKAYDMLSRADVFRGRIIRRQHWRFQVYIKALITAGIALAKNEKYPGYTAYTPTKRILARWIANNKNRTMNEITEKLAKKTHTSVSRTRKEYMPFISYASHKNRKMADSIASELGLSSEEHAWLVR